MGPRRLRGAADNSSGCDAFRDLGHWPPPSTAEGSGAARGPHCAATARLVIFFSRACFAAKAPLPATCSPLRHVWPDGLRLAAA